MLFILWQMDIGILALCIVLRGIDPKTELSRVTLLATDKKMGLSPTQPLLNAIHQVFISMTINTLMM